MPGALSLFRIVGEKMNDYIVGWEKDGSGLVVVGAFSHNYKIIEIPHTDPDRKKFIDLFLHKADIGIGLSYLDRISTDNDLVINESLFIVALNSCMKCFKRSNSREKLDKARIFSNSTELFALFKRYEIMRDKHYVHDENGMFQPLAIFFLSQNNSSVRFDSPSVIWNRAKLDYIEEKEKLTSMMQFLKQCLEREIDCIGVSIIRRCAKLSPAELKQLEVYDMARASISAPRDTNKESPGERINVRFISTSE